MLNEWLIPLLAALFGGGGIAGIYKLYVDRKLNIESREGDAKAVQHTSMTTILNNLDSRLTKVQERLDKQEATNRQLVRINAVQFSHILLLERGHPEPVPERPAETEWMRPTGP